MALNLFDLTGQTAIVTGSTRGIGLAIATAMAEQGARVVISSRKIDACEDVAAELRAAGHQAVAIACHVGREDDLHTLIEQTRAAFGPVTALVCNAAVSPHYGPLSGISREAWDKTMETNISSTLTLCNLAAPDIAAQGGGSITIISSIAGVRGSAVIGAYSISKAADMALSRSLAVELGPQKVRVNCIAPGLVKTELARARWEDPQKEAAFLSTYPIGRLGEPEDIAGAAVFLAARSGAWVTGQTIFVDGGVTISGG